jgi:hypothetical protein
MEKVALIRRELVSISYEPQGSFSGVGSVEEIAKVLRSLLKGFRFEQLKLSGHPVRTGQARRGFLAI